jgi:hypothetical protein
VDSGYNTRRCEVSAGQSDHSSRVGSPACRWRL